MTPYVSRLTVHTLGGRKTGYGEFLHTIAAAGRRLPFVKCRDDFGAGFEAKQLWPDMPVIGAMTEWDDAGYNVDVAMNRILYKASQNPHVTHWEYFNERAGDWQSQADFYLELMPRLERANLKLCAFNCGGGAFPYPSEDGGVAFTQIARVALRAKQGGHWLGVHGYGYDFEHNVLRYRKLDEYLFNHGARCEIALTELGPNEGTFIGVDPFMDWAKQVDAELMKDACVVGGALWVVGSAGWGEANCDAVLHDFKDTSRVYLDEYISTAQPVSVEPPPEPLGKIVTLTATDGLKTYIDVPPGYTVEVEDQI